MCWMPPGNVALGVHMGAVKGAKAKRYMEVARGITRTCYEMYNRTATGAPASTPSQQLLVACVHHLAGAMNGLNLPQQPLCS